MLSPCLRLWSSSCFGNRTCDRGASSEGPRFTYGSSRYMCRLGYPLLIPSTVAPESLFERMRSSRGSFRRSSFCGVARATPAGVALEPLEEFLTPSKVMLLFLMETLSISPHLRKLSVMKGGALGLDRLVPHRGRDVLPVERASPTPGRAPIR